MVGFGAGEEGYGVEARDGGEGYQRRAGPPSLNP